MKHLLKLDTLENFTLKHFHFLLLIYFVAHLVIRLIVSDSLELDEAEQVYYAQWLKAGYSSQPPLYHWLQIIFFKIFGTHLFSVSLLKNSILYFTYWFYFLSANELFKSPGKKIDYSDNKKHAVLATLSLLMIPQIAWESQRDLSHTVLSVAIASMLLFILLRLCNEKKSFDYVWFGVLVGAGFLAKYNFLLYATCLSIAFLTTKRGRGVFFHPFMGLSVLLTCIVILPHILWVWKNFSTATASLDKVKISSHLIFFEGTGSLLLSVIAFITPLWVIYLILIPKGYLGFKKWLRAEQFDLKRYFIVLLVFFGIFIFGFKMTYFKDRWMQPLLFLFPLMFFQSYMMYLLHFGPNKGIEIPKKVFLRFMVIAGCFAFLILFVMSLRMPLSPKFDSYSRWHVPFSELSELVKAKGFLNGNIITVNRHYGGNLKYQFKNSRVYIPNEMDFPDNIKTKPLLIVWNRDESENMPTEILNWISDDLGFMMQDLKLENLDIPYKYSKRRYLKVGIVFLIR